MVNKILQNSRFFKKFKSRVKIIVMAIIYLVLTMFSAVSDPQVGVTAEYSNTRLVPWTRFRVGSTVGSFPGVINCPFNRWNAIYPKHRGEVLKARKAGFHGLKAFMVGQTVNRLFHGDRSSWREAWTLFLVFRRTESSKIDSAWLQTKAIRLHWFWKGTKFMT